MASSLAQFDSQNPPSSHKGTSTPDNYLKAVMNTVLDGLIIIDSKGTIQSFNPSAEAIFGYVSEDVIGKNVKMLMPEPYHSGHDGYLHNYLTTGEKKVIGIGREVSGQRKDGSIFPMDLGINEMRLDGARMFVGTVRDISQRKKSEEALRQSEERYELAVQGLSVGIWDWDIPTNKLYWSPRFKEILRFYEEDLEDHYSVWESRVHPEDVGRTVEMLQNHLKKIEPYMVEYRLRRKDGSYAWIQAKGQAVWDKEGNPVRMVGSIEDITWRKESEAEKEKIINKLTESNSELERFAYICSHDLQEPLRMISSFSQLLQKHMESSLDEKGRHYMKYIMDGATQARQLISDVLNYARVDHETELLANVEGEVVFANVLRDLSARIEETGAHVTHDTLPAVHMQSTHLRQLLQNLIGNALKFCSEKPHIHVGAKKEGAYWCFFVRDNGIGISEEHIHRIFSIFQRLHSRERYPGTGIGLALCKKVVQKYEGRIWVESEPGKGSTFYFTLPSAVFDQSEAA